ARKLGYGITPEEIKSSHQEILKFWLRREVLMAERWIEEIQAGNISHRSGLRELCLQHDDDFMDRLSVSREALRELLATT
ncbi:MAG TPA: hypothetical protein VMR98_04425, partial [Candidatus Polarisedimenticolaceae bacterium]|nr:hypothetical protein [Candidatus Polarisedimenticolaceae bacterium]